MTPCKQFEGKNPGAHIWDVFVVQKFGSMLCCAQRSRASRVVTNGFLLTCTSRDDLLVDDGRTSRNDRFFRYSAKITRPTLHIGSGFVQFVPVHPWKGKPGVWFDRFCFHLFRTRPHLSRGSRFFVLPARPLWAMCYE